MNKTDIKLIKYPLWFYLVLFSYILPAVCQYTSLCCINPLYIQIDISAAGIDLDFQDEWQLWDLVTNWCSIFSCPEHMKKQ